MLGHHRHASETPFKLCFADGPLIALIVVFGPSLPTLTKKTLSRLDLLSQNFLDGACYIQCIRKAKYYVPSLWESRVNFVTIFGDLYQNKLWGICNNLNQFTHLSSAS